MLSKVSLLHEFVPIGGRLVARAPARSPDGAGFGGMTGVAGAV
jgi:hypothetical protein